MTSADLCSPNVKPYMRVAQRKAIYPVDIASSNIHARQSKKALTSDGPLVERLEFGFSLCSAARDE